MAYDEELADRLRLLLSDRGLAEKKMFGGLAFLLNGHMAVAVSGQGGLMVRVDPAETETLRAEPGAGPMEMQGRTMQGWLRVDAASVDEDPALRRWAERGFVVRRVAAAEVELSEAASSLRACTDSTPSCGCGTATRPGTS